jgi:beta-D-xylosidase 4
MRQQLVPFVLALSTFQLRAVSAQQNRIREFPDCLNGPLASSKICDTSAPPSERAAALVALLEPEEKLENLIR